MKKIFLFVVVASLFIVSTSFAANWNIHVESPLLTSNSSGAGKPMPDTWSVAVGPDSGIGATPSDFHFAADTVHWVLGDPHPASGAPITEDQTLVSDFWGVEPVDPHIMDPIGDSSLGGGAGTYGNMMAEILPTTNSGGNHLSVMGITFLDTTETSFDGLWWVGLKSGTDPDNSMNWMFYMMTEAYSISGTIEPPAVPIPGAVWLLFSGLVGIIGLRRRTN